MANAPQVIPIPAGLSVEVASALVVAGATAMLTLREGGQLQPGERVLVQRPGAGSATTRCSSQSGSVRD